MAEREENAVSHNPDPARRSGGGGGAGQGHVGAGTWGRGIVAW